MEVEGQPDYDAGAEFAVEGNPATTPDGLGDDPNNSSWDSADRDGPVVCTDDENGVQFMTPLVPGYEAIIDVRKVGLERFLYNMSRQQPVWYGLMSLVIAIAAGWGASTAFRLLREK